MGVRDILLDVVSKRIGRNIQRTFVASMLFTFPLWTAVSAQTPPTDTNAYAVSSKTFDLEDFGRPSAKVDSPDGRKTIRLMKDGSFAVFEGTAPLTSISVKELSSNIEVGWSPDSTQFFISWSNGGAIGAFVSRIFRIESGKVVRLNAPQIAYEDFKIKHFCPERGMNNEYVLGWSADSKDLFLVLEVYPSRGCKERSLFRGYLVEAGTGNILRMFSESDTNLIKDASRQAGFVTIPAKIKVH
jgi:hypothetical protein